MLAGDYICMPYSKLEFTLTDKMLILEAECRKLLSRLSSEDWFENFQTEVMLSINLSSTYGDFKTTLQQDVRNISYNGAAKYLYINPVISEDSINSAWRFLTADAIRLKAADKVAREFTLKNLVEDINGPILCNRCIIKAAFAHTALATMSVFLEYNEALARLIVYPIIAEYFPTIWNCSLSKAINCGNNTIYRSSVSRVPTTFAMECFMNLLHKTACIAYIKQEVGDCWERHIEEIRDFLYQSSNIGKIDKLIKSIKEDSE